MASKRSKKVPGVLTHAELDRRDENWQMKYLVEVETINRFIEMVPRWEQYRWLLTQLATALAKVVEHPELRVLYFGPDKLDVDRAKRIKDGSPMTTFAVATLWQQPSLSAYQERLNAVSQEIDELIEKERAELRAAADKAYGPRVEED